MRYHQRQADDGGTSNHGRERSVVPLTVVLRSQPVLLQEAVQALALHPGARRGPRDVSVELGEQRHEVIPGDPVLRVLEGVAVRHRRQDRPGRKHGGGARQF
jgi:hypothetical protein